MTSKGSSANAVKSAARALDIVEEVSRRGSVTARELSRVTNIPESSLSYLLTTLVSRNWLSPSSDRTYVIGPALSRLAVGAPPTEVERRAAMLRQIMRATAETASLFIRRENDVEVLDAELSTHTLRFTPHRGLRVPMHSFAAGKALLAELSPERLNDYMALVPRMRFTPYTLADEASLREDLRRTTDRGYALAREEHTIGVVGIAVALDEFHSLSVAVPTPRYDHLSERRIVAAIFIAVKELGTPTVPSHSVQA